VFEKWYEKAETLCERRLKPNMSLFNLIYVKKIVKAMF